jgi:uncharacterized protein (DUF2164 family)
MAESAGALRVSLALTHYPEKHAMEKIEFSKEEQTRLVARIQTHFRDEFEMEFGRFEAESVLQFFAGVLGPQFYNRGLHDAQAQLTRQVELFNDAVYQLERVPEK